MKAVKSTGICSWLNLSKQEKSVHDLYHRKLEFDITSVSGEKKTSVEQNIPINLPFEEVSAALTV